ncbi:hypothetical protein BDZ97DRAFT_1774944 [Flammula alnicola]|nr:hypothetical protein BDZ97DRAFT_1774944 [Flammula alnicola]
MHPDHDHDLYNKAVLTIHNTYSTFSYRPQHSQWTILASFFLTRQSSHTASPGAETVQDAFNDEIKIISLATGTKCEAVHDSHAEVLARRCALRWFLEEIRRVYSPESHTSPDGKYTLRARVRLNLYVSTVPYEEMAALKNSSAFPDLHPTAASRGRDNYARLGVLRTKPGRADSPPTLCMSCSDKIAVPKDLRDVIHEDCERALWKRLSEIQGPPPRYFSIHRPYIYLTDLPFIHSRMVLESSTSCNECIINGLKRGCRLNTVTRESEPGVSRIALLHLYNQVLAPIELKCLASPTYQAAKSN